MANNDQGEDQDRDSVKSTKGAVKEVVGAVTGDRHVEAEGRVERKVADPQAPDREESDQTVHEEERTVRSTHGDIPAPDADERGPLGT